MEYINVGLSKRPSALSSCVGFAARATSLCGSLLVAVFALLFVPQARAQANSNALSSNSSQTALPSMRSEDRFTWIEQFSGSTETEGHVMLLDSSDAALFGL